MPENCQKLDNLHKFLMYNVLFLYTYNCTINWKTISKCLVNSGKWIVGKVGSFLRIHYKTGVTLQVLLLNFIKIIIYIHYITGFYTVHTVNEMNSNLNSRYCVQVCVTYSYNLSRPKWLFHSRTSFPHPTVLYKVYILYSTICTAL